MPRSFAFRPDVRNWFHLVRGGGAAFNVSITDEQKLPLVAAQSSPPCNLVGGGCLGFSLANAKAKII